MCLKRRCRLKGAALGLAALMGLAGCVKVSDLSDNGKVVSCEIQSALPPEVVFTAPEIEGQEITLPMDYGKYAFPVTVYLALSTDERIDTVLGFDQELPEVKSATDRTLGGPQTAQPLVFETPETTRTLYVVALSGVAHKYTVSLRLKERSEEAAVEQCLITSVTPESFPVATTAALSRVQHRVDFFAVATPQTTFPLTLTTQMQLSEEAHLEDPTAVSKFTFSEFNQEQSFTVVASSGRRQQWMARLVNVPVAVTAEETDPLVWETLTPQTALQLDFSPQGPHLDSVGVDPARSVVEAVIRPNHTPFPWTATPTLTIDNYQQIIGLNPQIPLSIEAWEVPHVFYLIDPFTPMARAWTLLPREWLNHKALVESFTALEYESGSNPIVLDAAVVDSLTFAVHLPMVSGKDFPLLISNYQMEISQDASHNLPEALTFASHHTVHAFEVTAANGYVQPWTLHLAPWYATEADICAFTVEAYESAENKIQLKSPQAQIDAEKGTVTLTLANGYDFPLAITHYHTELSPKAQWLSPDPSAPLVFATVADSVRLTVQAESGDERSWHLVLADERVAHTEALVESFYVTAYQGTSQTAHNVEMERWAEVDTLRHTVSLLLTNWSNKLPLQVSGNWRLSPNATIIDPPFFATTPMVFNSLEDTHTFTVQSESRTKEVTWTVQLIDRAPTRSSEAQVVRFAPGTPSAGFVFDNNYLEPTLRKIVLQVRQRPDASTGLTIEPRFALSEGAKALGITNGAPIVLYTGKPYDFSIMAADETVRHWQIELLYAPQVYNSSFDEWGNVSGTNNVLPANGRGWTTGNNMQVSGATRVEGHNSPYATLLTTQLKTMNLVIYKVTSLAAGALYLGNFTLKVEAEALRNPESMAAFGIPFVADTNPIGYEIDYKYQAGEKRVYTRPLENSLIPGFHDPEPVDGPDYGIIATEIHYAPHTYTYSLDTRYNQMIAGDEYLASTTTQWQTLRRYFTPIEGREHQKMTHLVVRTSSSYQGYYYRGAHGSQLWLDNFKLLYYKPQEDAILLN